MRRFIVALVVSLHFASLAVAGMKTDRQEAGLVGPVQTVRIETAQFSNQSGQWVEGPRGLSATITYDTRGNKTEENGNIFVGKTIYTYDAQGNRTETASYNSEGSLSSKTSYTYDAQGRRTKTVSYGPGGSLLSQTLYTYDDKGNLTEETSSDAFGLIGKTVYTYNDNGNLAEEVIYDAGGSSIKSRSIHTYDAQGHRVETVHYDLAHDPALGIDRTVETYDANGNILELTAYYTQKAGDPEERPIPPPSKFVYTYEWDTHGNWVKQTQSLCTSESGKPVCEPSMVTYRTIAYYSETEMP